MRPYRDDEVGAVLGRLRVDADFLHALSVYRFPRLSRVASALARRLTAAALRRHWSGVETVRGCQMSFKPYVERLVAQTVTALSCSGLDRLDPDGSYLFISNHRDIAMDPAFVNYSLHLAGSDTVRIAIGDNLLKRRYVADLMRLNKSFVVSRGGDASRSRRQRYQALRTVSEYIAHSLSHDRQSVWMAQSEGRAKDGRDRSSEAVIKMLAMAKRKDQPMHQYMRALSIVPVAIAYELDPCDALKAKELHARECLGSYVKSEAEDDESIAIGIVGHKGRVHLSYGEPLLGHYDSPAAVVAEIDAHIAANYRLWPTAHFARQLLAGEAPPPESASFVQRIMAMPQAHRRYALAMYANPLRFSEGDVGESAPGAAAAQRDLLTPATRMPPRRLAR